MQTITREVTPVLSLSNFKNIVRIKPRPMTVDELERSGSKRKRETNRERIVREMKEEAQKRPPYQKPSRQP